MCSPPLHIAGLLSDLKSIASDLGRYRRCTLQIAYYISIQISLKLPINKFAYLLQDVLMAAWKNYRSGYKIIQIQLLSVSCAAYL